MRNLYEILGVISKASAQEIAHAWKALAKKHHPDAGGDKLKFQELSEAYTILSDPIKRLHYDKTGSAEIVDPLENTARQFVMELLLQVVHGDKELANFPLMRFMHETIVQRHKMLVDADRKIQRQLDRLTLLQERLIHKKEPPDILHKMLQATIEDNLRSKDNNQQEKAMLKKASELINSYEFVSGPEFISLK